MITIIDMIIQYNCQLSRAEEGKFLALDLGGTNFRVILVELEGKQFHMDSEVYSVPQDIMLGTGEQLFDHIANCLCSFTEKHNLKNHRLPLGFTFSFPCRQEGLARAKLVNWTKGFKCSGVEGQDVVQLLTEAIARRPDIDIEVMAVVNDTTGTLMSCAYDERECRVGLIVGTGTNACYMETIDNVHLYEEQTTKATSNSNQTSESQQQPDQQQQQPEEQQQEPKPQQIVVNTEWGAFGDNGVLDFVSTQWDREIDDHSINKGKQRFEKLISGLYIGELCRRIIVDLCQNRGLIFNGQASKKMCELYSFGTKYVSMVETDVYENNETKWTRMALKEAFELDDCSDEDCLNIQLICSRVSTRAAHLVSAAVATLLNKMQRPHTTVGVDGSVFKYHPHFQSLMSKKTKELTKEQYKFNLMFSQDGSGRGAALVAAVACKQRRISQELIERQQQQQQQEIECA